MELNIGEFIRTKKGNIGKVVYISNIANRKSYAIEWNKTKTYFISQIKDIKHSKNIIDLIEVGDYVNGNLISHVDKIVEKNVIEWDNGEMYTTEILNDKYIKSIVTKEMMKNVMYEV